jgi:Uma2 family endonuclease
MKSLKDVKEPPRTALEIYKLLPEGTKCEVIYNVIYMKYPPPDEEEKKYVFMEGYPRTALEIYRLLPKGTRCEVVDNVLYMSPTPDEPHQAMVHKLYSTISDHVEKMNLGELFNAPVDVYFEDLLSVTQPDLAFVSKENLEIIEKDGIHGTPQLIIEVLDKYKNMDLVEKKDLYQRAGVLEYFTVEPEINLITHFYLFDGVYSRMIDFFEELTSEVLDKRFYLKKG